MHYVKDFHPAHVRPNEKIVDGFRLIGILLWIGRALLIALWMNLLPRATAPTGMALLFSAIYLFMVWMIGSEISSSLPLSGKKVMIYRWGWFFYENPKHNVEALIGVIAKSFRFKG